jgi:acyl-CoA dehydrogenase
VLEDWGRRGVSAGGFSMEGVEIPADYLIGEENKGFYLTMEGFDFARAIIGVVCCGAALSVLEQSMEYIKMRSTFGQPIAKYQGVQFKLAEHWTKLDAARLLAYRALWTYAKAHAGDRVGRFDVTRACAEAKLMAPILAFEAINDAIQWYGAFGYTSDNPMRLALEGVRSYYWAEGAMEIMRIIVARELLGKAYVAYR